ncbi:MAG: glutamine--fructose-6-phosphate transaminase (isomerizing) [Sulfurospirillum sp.]|nr:glutamine--fructose-6-phosphate transaminase (isomerizing) [Sulfurospirillum sp.]MBL0703563.1 glutamine--fructose-6-phosphate transaminase (isomerizing) [Sulfurospirillum sp.]
MCGIIGYIGEREKKEFLINGLKELEYRGYDSAGIATFKNGHISSYRALGKLENLIHKTDLFSSDGFGLGIGHTRWATHGKPTEINAHPHCGEFSHIIHNGIIENHREIKKNLLSKGVKFLSQTDSEVIVHQFEKFISEGMDAKKAFKNTIEIVQGAYAILLITKDEPDTIFFAKSRVPLMLGTNRKKEKFMSSSDAPLMGHATEVVYLEDGEYGWITKDEISIFADEQLVTPKFITLKKNKIHAQKNGFRFFMEKEIYEQSNVISETFMGRVSNDSIELEELNNIDFNNIDSIKICACGTSYHAGLVATYLFERLSKIKCQVEIASEFRYKEPLLDKKTLFLSISQSGETADTLEALKIAKIAGLTSLAICNVDNSSIVRLSDVTLLTRAGIERGVASTKAFATQVATLWLLALYIGKNRKTISKEKMRTEIEALLRIPSVLVVKNSTHEKIKRLSKRYLHGHGFFFIGRDIFFPLALEGALKLKEISYLHAEGYPAGEMKHGPIALVDSELFTIALMPQTILYDKIKNNVEELSARDATILAISPKKLNLADDFIKTSNQSHPMSEFFEMMIIMQILALEIAVRLGNDIDMPRNLAKSVTVE